MADEINNRTAPLYVEEEKKEKKDRPCAVYVVRKDVLELKDIINERPIDYPNEIHISWIDKALNQFAKEQKYSAWDLIQAPQGAWVSSAYGNKCGIVAGADSQVIITLDNGNTWETVSVIADLSCIAFGSKVNEDDTVTNRFIALSSTGQGIYSDDNGKTWQALTIPNDNYTGIAFIKGKFIAISSTGKIYVSYDMGITFNELTIDVAGFQFTSIATDGNNRVMIVGNSGTKRALYSDDVALTFKETGLSQNTWTSITYGEGKFIAVSTDGDNNIAVFDVNTNNWAYTQAPTQEEWRSISYGARVFTAVATSGKVISSLDGNRWLSVSAHIGEWNTILRTDYFFIALSIADNEQGYNAMRSSNAGMSTIDYATLEEVINQEPTLKAISIQVLIQYLKYRTPWKLIEGGTERTDGYSQGLASDITTASKTLKYLGENTTADKQATAALSIIDGNIYHTEIGKNKGNIASYDKDGYINTLVEMANSLNIQLIDDTSPITSYDEIIDNGYYKINKDLANKPNFDNVIYLLVFDIYQGTKIFKNQVVYRDLFYNPHYCIRIYINNSWTEWDEYKINQYDINDIDLSADNITVSKSSTKTAVNTFLITDINGDIVTVGKDEIVGEIVDDVNAGIDLTNYFNKNTDKLNLSKQVENVLSIANGGTSGTTKEQAQKNLGINDFERHDYKKLDLNKAKNGVLVARPTYLENKPSNLISSGEIIIETVLGQNSTTFSDNDEYTYNIQIYKSRSSFEYAQRVCKPNGVVGEWKKLRNWDGSIPEDLIPVKAPKYYTTSAGNWVETPLSDGSIMLEGHGSAITGEQYENIIVTLPKTMQHNFYFASATLLFDIMGSVSVVNTTTVCEFRFLGANGSIKRKTAVWYIRGILA